MVSIPKLCEESPWPASVLVGARPSEKCLGGVYLPLCDKEFPLYEVRMQPDLYESRMLSVGWDAIVAFSDCDLELGGKQRQHASASTEAAAAVSRGDDRTAVQILSNALSGTDGQQHPHVTRFAEALAAWREDHPKPPNDPLDDPDPPRDPPVGGDLPPTGSLQDRVIAAVRPLLNEGDDVELDIIARALAATVASRRGSQDWTPFPLACLPRPLGDFVEQAAASHSVDRAAVALPCLATLAAALGNSHELRLKPGFEVPAVLWCILVARTGTNKSGPLSLAVRPMHDDPPMSMIEQHLLVPSQGQYVVDDATIEAVLARLSESSRGLLLHGEELSGWVASFDAYKKASGGDMQKWLRMWDVNPYRLDRKGSDERLMIRRPAVSIAGAIQPELLGKAVDPEKLASGFFARTLCCMPPEQKRRWTNVGVDEQQTKFWRDLIDTLRTRPFASLNPGTRQFQPNIVTLDPQALACLVRYYGEISDRLDGSTGAERGIVAKADVQSARLALVLHGARCSLGETKWGEPMPESTMAAGVELGRWFLNETIRVFERTCGEAQNQRQDSLMELVRRKGGKLTPRDVQRSNSRKYPTSEISKNALQNLANAGHGVFDGRIFTCGKQ